MIVERQHLCDNRDAKKQMSIATWKLEGALRNSDDLADVRVTLRSVLEELRPIDRTYCYHCHEPEGTWHRPDCLYVTIHGRF